MQRRAYVRGIGFHVPARRMGNNEFEQLVDTSDEWIVSHTGIRYRHIASKDDTVSGIAIAAAEKALHDAGVERDDIDCIIVATSTGDYHRFPSTACVVQQKLGIKHPIPSFDISAACSGFIYGLSITEAFVAGGKYRNILLIGSEIFSRILDWSDRGTCILFGDGAGAAVISESTTESAIIDSILYTDSNNYQALTCDMDKITMNGKKVYLFAVKALEDAVKSIMERNQLTFDDIRWVVPHQANIRIIEAACERGGFDRDRFYANIERYANTSAASVPIALAEMNQDGLLKRGDAIITVGFGAGLSYGANLIRW